MQKIKSTLKHFILIFSLSMLVCFCSVKGSEANEVVTEENLNSYLKLIEKDPDNCLYLDQIASCYQRLNKFYLAIEFYEKASANCDDNTLILFQIGVCYYLIMEKTTALDYMDKAINQARESNNKKMIKMLKDEKEEWLKKWDFVKKLDWNKQKEQLK